MLTILITIIAIIGWIGCVYYKGKAKEFESLFELSKGYEDPYNTHTPRIVVKSDGTASPTKLNKDGSIAKKRGRKSNAKTT